jgi:hypothetical protein
MKQLFFAVAFFAVAGLSKLNAQTSYTLENVLISSIKINDGSNTVQVPGGRGTLKFTKRGETFTNVVYIDAAGKESPLRPSTGNAPKPECKYPIPSACYSIPNNQNIGMCICRPNEVSAGNYNISLLLPAVQAAREAARRTSTTN